MVTVADVENAQLAWGDGIVAIASAHKTGGDYVQIARNHVETLYAYDMTPVLFKPTFAAIDQFRPTFDSALSYFCLLYTSPSPRDGLLSRMPSSA